MADHQKIDLSFDMERNTPPSLFITLHGLQGDAQEFREFLLGFAEFGSGVGKNFIIHGYKVQFKKFGKKYMEEMYHGVTLITSAFSCGAGIGGICWMRDEKNCPKKNLKLITISGSGSQSQGSRI